MSTKVTIADFSKPVQNSPFAATIRNAGRWLVRRIVPVAGATQRALTVEERISIGPKKTLALIRCHNQQFLVATAGDSVGPIVEIALRKAARRSDKEREK